MPKNDPMGPKALANRMKSKGLQKLRWFCQMCQKQCRDDNGFKCHLMSEGHLRQMKLFQENSSRIMDSYSVEFRDTFLKLLSSRYGTRRVFANQVYQEFISDKQHMHMNSTRWTSLTSFIHYLSKAGHCRIDETERGWFIAWVDNSPKALAQKEAIQKQDRMKRDQEQVERKMIEEQIRKAREARGIAGDEGEDGEDGDMDKVRSEFQHGETIRIDLKSTHVGPAEASSSSSSSKKKRLLLDDEEEEEHEKQEVVSEAETTSEQQSKKKSRWDDQAQEPSGSSSYSEFSNKGKDKEQMDASTKPSAAPIVNQEDQDEEQPWLQPGIVVKLLTHIASDKYYGQKAQVIRIPDPVDNPFIADCETLAGGDVLRVDQVDCETVIPAIGGRVMVLRGHMKGKKGVVRNVDFDKYKALIGVDGDDGDEVWLEYEWFSKLHNQS